MRQCRILALDQALQTSGYSVFEDEKLVAHGTFTIPNKSDMAWRLGEMVRHLNELYAEYGFDRVVFEGIQNQNNAETFKKLAYVQAAVMLWCHFTNLEYDIVSPSVWRSTLGGNFGKVRAEQKQHAIDYVKDVYDIEVESDEADAICIGAAHVKGDSVW